MVQSLDDTRRRQGVSAGGRVPPHNLEAEESLLGAMLLSRDAIVAAVEAQLTGEDFYKPAHGHIFEAITSLYAQGEPADPVTVADELRRAGLLEGIGGPATLISVQARTPAIGNATRYATIVEEHSLLRRLIAVAGQIAESGYSVPDDVLAAIDEAEAMVFDVAQRRVTDSMLPIRELLELHLDHIEALYERGQDIIGVPTGYLDLDHQLAGLQPSNLVIIGGRPGTGKALSLNTSIATPSGWTTMGELSADDEIFDEQGQRCRVTYATPVMHDRQCYEVSFDDGSSIVADADHQWFAYDFPAWKSFRDQAYRTIRPPENPSLARDQSAKRHKPRVVTTRQMLDEGLVVGRDGRPNWYIPLTQPLDPPEAELPVDPYVLGCWLGDGKSSGSEMTIGELDSQHFHDEFVAAGYAFERRVKLQWATVPVGGKGKWQGYRGPLRVLTRELLAVGLLGGGKKHIPAAYLRASFKQRLALLQGLLDTDGHITKSGSVELCLSSEPLIEQTHELVCSLGHKPGPVRQRSIRLPDGRITAAWRFGWVPLDPVFRLARKADRYENARSRRDTGRVARRAVTEIRPVPSVPVRCITVDSPNSLYLAGRSMIPTHNTSFALGIAAHAALDARAPVLVFSLEMSHLELTQRLLCSEARVDASRMRNGKLLEADWPKISHAVGRLAESPIHIDDNPRLTVMEIRAKARRLKSRHGLGLIIIDYLQLMTGRTSAENRQVEVSEISRGLKILARELEIPVIALSQLSRNLETRADKRPILADLRESGCLTADTRLLRADTGAEVTMGELFVNGERDIPVWSLDEDLKMVPARMNRVFSTGVKPVFELQLASGRSVKATANHPFLTIDGWVRLDELEMGSRIAVPRLVPPPTDVEAWPEAEVVMLAHLLGDGCFASGQPIHYTSADPANVEAVEDAAAHFGITPRRVHQKNWWHVYLPAPYKLTHGKRNPIAAWLGRLGLYGLRSREKFIPQEVFSLPDDQIAFFLRHLWATDGSVGFWGGQGRLYYASSSRRLVEGVQQLLLRFEIQCRIAIARKAGYQPGYHLQVIGAENQLRFIEEVGIHGERGSRAEDLCHHLETVTRQPYADSVPVQVLERIVASASGAGMSRHALVRQAGYSESFYKAPPGRARLGRVAEVLQDPNLKRLAHSDIFWDKVVSIVALGEESVFDGTVEPTHNFVANGITSENSLEQDADVVIFLYRDELYNRDSPDRGTAEVIVAKHRNGPVGITQLAFLENYTRFANMARGV